MAEHDKDRVLTEVPSRTSDSHVDKTYQSIRDQIYRLESTNESTPFDLIPPKSISSRPQEQGEQHPIPPQLKAVPTFKDDRSGFMARVVDLRAKRKGFKKAA